MDDEAGLVRLVRLRRDRVALDVDLHQVRCGDLVEAQPVGVDQEVMVAPGDARADVRVDELGPAEVIGDAIGAGELDPQVPFDPRQARPGGEGYAHWLMVTVTIYAAFLWYGAALLPA